MKLGLLKRLSDWLKQSERKEKQDESGNLVFPEEKPIIPDSSSIKPRNSLISGQTIGNRFPGQNISLRRKRRKSGDPLRNTHRKIMRGTSKTALEKKLWDPRAPLESEEN